MKKYRVIALFVLLLGLFSCSVTKEQTSNYQSTEGKTQVVKKGKEIYLFWDSVTVQEISGLDKLPNYQKVRQRGFFDVLAFYGTLGIFSSYNVTIKTKKTN